MKQGIAALVCAITLVILLSLNAVQAFSIIPELPETSATSEFTQIIGEGTLSVDIAEENYAPVVNPSVAMNTTSFEFVCHDTAGTFGTPTEKIYVKNPDASDSGWSVALAAYSPYALWSSEVGFDFNDISDAGCSDGADSDSRPGRMTVDPSDGILTRGACLTCSVTGVSRGASEGFEEGVLDSITILTGAGTSDDIGDWVLTGVAISQTIPPEQPAAADYSIDLTLTIAAI